VPETLSSAGFSFPQGAPDGGAGEPGTPEGAEKGLQALMADPSEDPWAIDEVNFQPHGSIDRIWFPPETKDPVLLPLPTRRSAGFSGTVGLRDGTRFSHREAGKLTAPPSLSF